MFWSSIQRTGMITISFVGNLIFAHLLSPDDFGCIGLLSVFIVVSETFIDGGFGAALLQKKSPTNRDYSTIFFWNIIVAVFCYLCLLLAAPHIAKFYKIELLKQVLPFIGLVLILNAFSVIQVNQLMKKMLFKKMTPIYLIAHIIGITVGCIAAFFGYGVWSLVLQQLLIALIIDILLWKLCEWRPIWCFDLTSFKSLFSYGSLVLLTNLIQNIYNNLSSLIIGRVFSTHTLGYYTQARKLVDVPVNALSQIVNQVTFPFYANYQDNIEQLRESMRKSLKVIAFLNFGLMALLVVLAPSVFDLLFGEKWASSIPLFQLLCIAYMLYTITTTNMNAIRATGRSDIVFYGQVVKKSVGLIVLLIGVCYDLYGLMIALIVDMYLHVLINSFLARKVLKYKISLQFSDLFGTYILSILTFGIVYFFTKSLHFHAGILLLFQFVLFTLFYIVIAHVVKNEGYILIKDIVLEKFYKSKYICKH